MARVKCPHCGASMEIDDKFMGKQGRCGKCREIFTVPAPKKEEPEPSPLETLVEDPFLDLSPDATILDAFSTNPFASSDSESPFLKLPSKKEPVKPAEAPKPSVPPKAEKASPARTPFDEPPAVSKASGPSSPPASSNPFAAINASDEDEDSGFGLPGVPFLNESAKPAEPAKSVEPEPAKSVADPPVKPPAAAPVSKPAEDEELSLPFADADVSKASATDSAIDAEPSDDVQASTSETDAPVLDETAINSRTSGDVAVSRFVPSRTPPARSAANFANHKIEAIEATLVNLPCKGTFILAGGTYAAQGKPTPRVLVKVVGTNGVVGWGEVTPCPTWCYETSETILSTIRNYLAPALRGLPAWDVGRVAREMDRVIQPGATIGQPLAKSGIDSALHDFLARTLETPLYVLLGGKRVDSIWLSYIVSAHSADEAAQQAKQGLEAGYTAFKVKVGMNNEAIDRAIVEAVAQIVPKNAFLWVDANQGYGLDTAIRQAQFFGKLGVQAFEQPLKGARISAFRRLVNLQSVPIALDETLGTAADLIEHIKAEAVDLPVAKLQRCGGHYHSSEFCTVAEAAGLRLMGSGLCETDLGLAHGIQLFSAFGIDLPCDLNGRQFVESSFVGETVTVENGRVAIPDRPGCGVEVDEEKVAQLTVG